MVRATRSVIQFLFENSLLLLCGSVAGLVLANTYHEEYEVFAHAIHFFVNDFAMALFFGIAAKEIWESLLPGGKLSSWKTAALPVLATFGGVIAPAGVYLIGCVLLDENALIRGWAIPCATDIAFSYMVARFIFGASHAAIPFLLLLAIVDDGIGLLILAVFYPTGEQNFLVFFLFIGLAIGLGRMLNRHGVRSFWAYILVPGLMSWVGFYYGGIHPALALVPIIPTMPHEKRDLGVFAEDEDRQHDTLNEFEHWMKHPVEMILCLFGFINAGVVLNGIGTPAILVLGGLLIGKPLGIVAFTLFGCALGLRLPEGMGVRELIVLGITAGIGFTVALFVATVAFPAGALLDSAKMGALLSLFVSGVAFLAAWLLGVKRSE